MKIEYGSEYPIPKVYLVGYGSEQIMQYKCYSCGVLFFSPGECSKFLCSECEQMSGTIKVDSDIESYSDIIGILQKVETFKRRTVYNYKKVAIRDNYTCQYCGYSPRLFVDFIPMHVDHIIPFSHGGGNSMKNLIMACGKCNMHLSNKIFDDFHKKKTFIIEWRKENNEPYTHARWVELSRKRINR